MGGSTTGKCHPLFLIQGLDTHNLLTCYIYAVNSDDYNKDYITRQVDKESKIVRAKGGGEKSC